MHWWVKKMFSGPSGPKHSKAASHITIVAHIPASGRLWDHNTSLTNLEQSHWDAHYWVSVRAQHQLDYTRVACHTRDQWPFWKVTLTGQQTSVGSVKEAASLISTSPILCRHTFSPNMCSDTFLQNVKCFNFPLLLWPLSDLLLG